MKVILEKLTVLQQIVEKSFYSIFYGVLSIVCLLLLPCAIFYIDALHERLDKLMKPFVVIFIMAGIYSFGQIIITIINNKKIK